MNKNQIIQLKSENEKVLGFNDTQIMVSSKSYSSIGELEAGVAKSSILERKFSFPISSISEIKRNFKDDFFTIKYDDKGKNKSISFSPADQEIINPIMEELAEMRNFQKSAVAEKTTTPLLWNLLVMFIIIAVTIGFRMIATDAQSGKHYVAEGRRKGAGQFIADLVESIGPTWVTLIGIGALIITAIIAYKRYKNPAIITTYS